MRPNIDGRLALRLRELAGMQSDSEGLAATEKASILNIAADVLEEYVMDAQKRGPK